MSAGATYEVVLVGQFASSDFEPIFDRCTLRSTTSDSLHLREVVFEPQDEAMSAEMTRKGLVLVTCRADLGKNSGKGKWTLCCHSKSEPARLYPDVTVRQATYSRVAAGNASAFTSALGYKRKDEFFKKGYEFMFGKIVVHIYRSYQGDSSSNPSETGPYRVEVRSPPVRNTAESPITEQVDAVLGVATLMKGLLDLEPMPVIR